MTRAPRSHGHAVRVRTPGRPGLPLEWHVTTLCGRTFTTHHVDLGHVASVECPECARRLAEPVAHHPTPLALVRYAPPRHEAA